MKKTIQRVLAAVILFAMILSGGFSEVGKVHAEKQQGTTKRAIYVVFDNSGSMYGDGNKAWSQATYAMEVFAAMMNSKIKAVGFFRDIYFLPNVTMTTVVVIIWRWLLNSQYGIVDIILDALFGIRPAWMTDPNLTMLSMCMISVWSGMGYCIVILLSGLQGISQTYYEAARIDGASGLQQFFKITVPLLTPTIFFLLVTRIIAAFNQYDMVYMMADSATSGAVGPITDSLRTLVFGVYQSAFADMQMGYACAKAVFLFFVILIVTAIQMIGEKRWVNY